MIKPNPSDLLKTSIRSILKNKTRTLLTSLGIIIGVTSVILLTSIGSGLQIYISQQFDALGSNLIIVSPGKVFNDQGGFNSNSSGSSFLSTSFTLKDWQDLKRNLPFNQGIVPVSQTTGTIKYRQVNKNISIVATSYLYGKIRNSEPTTGHGSWFTKVEEDNNTPVTILGYQIAQDLFGNISPIGKSLILKDKNFKVIGVLDKKGGGFGGPSYDDYAYVPLELGFNLIGGQKIQSFIIKSQSKEDVEVIKKSTETILGKTYDKDGFSVFDQSQILSSINSILSTLTVALTGIAAISLIVGGIGIMNIMLVTVTERTKEIGLRKAIGATPRAILLQFLFEAIILSFIGGVIGIILGTLGTMAINHFFPAQVTANSILIAFGVSSAVGIIFGVAPARKASKLSPIEALRYE